MEQKIKITLNEALGVRGQTLYWLARATGISYTTLWRLTKDRALGINFATLEKLCQALECQPGEIMTLDRVGAAAKSRTKSTRPSRAARRTTSLL